jgi:hypothetical protein
MDRTCYAAFGVGLGNLGRHARGRVEHSRWVPQVNRLLAGVAGVVAAFGHTGNFVVASSAPPADIVNALKEAVQTPFALLTILELHGLVRAVSQLSPVAPNKGVRLTPGAALLVEGSASDQALQNTSRAEYLRWSHQIVLVRKLDVETPRGVLDRGRRGGGWGAIAGELGRQVGGRWTARSIRTLSGTLRIGMLEEGRSA